MIFRLDVKINVRFVAFSRKNTPNNPPIDSKWYEINGRSIVIFRQKLLKFLWGVTGCGLNLYRYCIDYINPQNVMVLVNLKCLCG